MRKLKTKMKKIEKNEKIQRKNTKLKKSKKQKKKNITFYIFLIISNKFGAYIKRFWYTLLTTWHYL